MIDSVLIADMVLINAISWYTLYSTGTSLTVAVSFQIVLMYLPLICFAAIGAFLFLQKRGIISKHFSFEGTEEGRSSGKSKNSTSQKKTTKHQEDNSRDDDLFSRAAEQNHPPLFLSGSEAGFELRSLETTLTTEVQ